MSTNKANRKRPLSDVTNTTSSRSSKKQMLKKPPPILKRTRDEATFDDDFFIVKRARKFPTQSTSTPATPAITVTSPSIATPSAATPPTISRAASPQPPEFNSYLPQTPAKSPLDDLIFVLKQATQSPSQATSTAATPATTVPSASISSASAVTATTTSRASSSQPTFINRFLQTRDSSPLDDDVFILTRARQSSTLQTASIFPRPSVNAASAATARYTSRPTSTQPQPAEMPIHFRQYLNGACPEKLMEFKERTAHYRRVLNARRPSTVATVPEWPHIARIRPAIKKWDKLYIPSKLSGTNKVVKTVVDYQIVNRHLKSQQKWHDTRLKSRIFVKRCHRLGVCTKEQDRNYKKSMIRIKWRGVAFHLDEKKKSD
ncbi:hypothetical protein HDU80_001623 [Chytriomyces hyalinus]|nr:hypothetical protein HDU80_001623 [Chytriomyces hyalinus]